MKQYLNLLQDILDNGEHRPDRTGVGTISVFDRHLTFDMEDGTFPAVTTKKLAFKSMIGELLWFLNGETSLNDLRHRTFNDHGKDPSKRTIWDANQKAFRDRLFCDGTFDSFDDCGYIYGNLWHHRNQFWEVVKRIITNPSDRRLMVNCWIPEIVNNDLALALPPCHYGFQFYVRGLDKNPRGTHLDIKWNQRSVDSFLGLSFNIASYATLLHIVAAITGLKAGKVSCTLGDVHIYENHVEQVREQLSREPKPLPKMITGFDILEKQFKSIDETDLEKSASARVQDAIECIHTLAADDFMLIGYEHHPAIKAPMAV